MGRALLVLVLLAACTKHRTVDLGFEENGASFGFLCPIPGTELRLASRAIRDERFRGCVYFDFIAPEGDTACGPNGIGDYCETRSCTALDDPLIQPIQIDVPAPNGETTREFIVNLARSLDGRVLTEEGPSGTVMIRAVFEAGTCRSTPPYAPHRAGDLIGCAVTCPLDLTTVDGDVPFALPPLGADNCYVSVVRCAGEGLRE